jgi:divalent metal cation (Fe/Co/Zn/Cd) transporter
MDAYSCSPLCRCLLLRGAEAAAGWWSGSLALLSDAVHMVTDPERC